MKIIQLKYFIVVVILAASAIFQNISSTIADDPPPPPDIVLQGYTATPDGVIFVDRTDFSKTLVYTFTCTSYHPVEWEFECPEFIPSSWMRITHEVSTSLKTGIQFVSNITMFQSTTPDFAAPDYFNCSCRIIEFPNINRSINFQFAASLTGAKIVFIRNAAFTPPTICNDNGSACPIHLNLDLNQGRSICRFYPNCLSETRSCGGKIDYCKSLSTKSTNQGCVNFVNHNTSGGLDTMLTSTQRPVLQQCIDGIGNIISVLIYSVNRSKSERIVELKAQFQPTTIMLRPVDTPPFYHGQEVEIECKFSSSAFYMGSIMSYKFLNGSSAILQNLKDETIDVDWLIRSAYIKMSKNVTSVTCNCSVLGSRLWTSAQYSISSIDPITPTIIHQDMGSNVCGSWFECNGTGFPKPTISWENYPMSQFPEEQETFCMDQSWSTEDSSVSSSRLQTSSNMTGKLHRVQCKAENGFGVARFAFGEESKPENNAVFIISWSLGSALLVLVVVIATYFVRRKAWLAKRLLELSQEELDEFFKGNEDISQHNDCTTMPYDPSFEISTEELDTGNSEILGSGEFSYVIKGRIKPSMATVAVKITKPSSDILIFKASLSEVKVMIHIGRHPNVVQLIGVNTSGIINRKLLICMEYCGLGSIKNYLKTAKPSPHMESVPPVSLLQMMRWAAEIANGMEFLASKSVVHADLAARNVLLDEDMHSKISDFGLSRKLYEEQDYRKTSKSPLPWRWMAIESLNSFTFSTKSDVWSYGVTLFEIFSYGDAPFPNETWDAGFPSRLENGLRLAKPALANQQLYEIMVKCWDPVAALRPDFTDLKNLLRTYYETIPEYENAYD